MKSPQRGFTCEKQFLFQRHLSFVGHESSLVMQHKAARIINCGHSLGAFPMWNRFHISQDP